MKDSVIEACAGCGCSTGERSVLKHKHGFYLKNRNKSPYLVPCPPLGKSVSLFSFIAKLVLVVYSNHLHFFIYHSLSPTNSRQDWSPPRCSKSVIKGSASPCCGSHPTSDPVDPSFRWLTGPQLVQASCWFFHILLISQHGKHLRVYSLRAKCGPPPCFL